MNQKRLLLYLVFALYQCIAFTFTIMVDGHLDLLGLLKFIPWFKYISFLGVVLILADFVWFWIDKRSTSKRQAELEKENTDLKARIFDSQEEAKKTASSKQA